MKLNRILLIGLPIALVSGLTLYVIGRSSPLADYESPPLDATLTLGITTPTSPVTRVVPNDDANDAEKLRGEAAESRRLAGEAEEGRDFRSIVGRIEFPAGAPSDDSLRVVALGASLPIEDGRELGNLRWVPGARSWEGSELLAESPVEADGTFRLSIPMSETAAPERSIELDVDGRHLYLPTPMRVTLSELSDAAMRVRPSLGGAIDGTVLLPAGATDLPGSFYAGAYGRHVGGAQMARATFVEGSLRFELRALDPNLDYTLWASSDLYPGLVDDAKFDVEPGRTRSVDLRLERGATVRGKVVDANGLPVADAKVRGSVAAEFFQHPNAGNGVTAHEGVFELRGLAPQEQSFSVRADGYLSHESERLPLTAGAEVDDVRIELDAGLSIRGRVCWPDHSPAIGAHLIVVPLESNRDVWRLVQQAKSDEGSATTDAAGSFVVPALPIGSYGLYGSARRDDAAADAPLSTGRLESVAAGADEIEVILSPQGSFQGRVIDDEETAIDAFSVTARRNNWPSYVDGANSTVTQEFSAAAGAFELPLDAGAWTLSVRTTGHLPSATTVVELPGSEVGTFCLKRTAALSGVVLDPSGRPVAEAEVRAIAQTSNGLTGVVMSDEEGRFYFDSVGPGELLLDAKSTDWAPSSQESLELVPGEARDRAIVRLTLGGSLTGIVFDATGAPARSRPIVMQSMEDVYETVSGVDGRFHVEHVAPGRYQVMAPPNSETMESSGTSGADWFADTELASATILDNQTTEIVLGAPPTDPVRVVGRVVRDGQPIAEANFMIIPEQGLLLSGMSGGTTQEDGTFDVTLNEPGPYTFVVYDPTMSESETDFQVDVPSAPQYRLDLDLPNGEITGRLYAPDGRAPEYGRVSARRLDGTSALAPFMGSRSVSVAEDGSFVIAGLKNGTYALSAIGTGAGMTTRHDVVVTAGRRSGRIDLRLRAGGSVSGVVRDEGGDPISGAVVFLRDASGRQLYQLDTITGSGGEFTIDRVPEGEVIVSARTTRCVGASTDVVVVRAGETSPSDVILHRGVSLEIELIDELGEPTRGAIRVVNQAGHETVECATRDELQRFFETDELPRDRCFGPLRPGLYTVTAKGSAGEMATAEVAIDPDDSIHSLRLTLHR